MKQYAVIGLGRFGTSLALTLQKMGQEVLGIDPKEETVNQLSGELTHIIQADATDINVLKSLGIRNFDVVVVSMSLNLEASLLITLQCKELGVPMVMVKAANDLHGRILCKAGADKVILPDKEMGVRVGRSLASNSVLEYMDLSNDYSLLEVNAIPSWRNKSIQELKIRTKYGVSIIAIKGKTGPVNVSPAASDVIREDDVLVIIGTKDDLNKIEKL